MNETPRRRIKVTSSLNDISMDQLGNSVMVDVLILNFGGYFQTRIITARTKLYLETVSCISSLISKEESFLFKIKGYKAYTPRKTSLALLYISWQFFSFFHFD